jgi:hypothetical protein
VASDLPCDLSVADAHPVQRGDRYALRLVQPRVLRRLAFLGLLRFLRIPAIGMLSALRLEGEFTRQRLYGMLWHRQAVTWGIAP